MREGLRQFKENFYAKYWTDPVWSKVISAGIITVFGSVLTAIFVLIKSLYEKVEIKIVAKEVFDYFEDTIEINNLIFWIAILLLAYTLYKFFKSFFLAIISKVKSPKIEKNEEPKQLERITLHSTAFFTYRLAKAFPGQRGLVWYKPKVAVDRLKILLQEPLLFESGGYDCMGDPIWWFRGGSALHIDKFKPLSKTKVLMGIDEIEIKRIGVFISDSYYKSFVYIEAKGEKQTGLYKYKPEDIERHIETFGYSSEEYGLLGNRPIRREQFDDGATVIKNKVLDASKAELRQRYLSDYNFIMTAKQAPYNSRKFCRDTKEYFNDILSGKITAETFFEYLETYEKHEE